MSDYYEPWHPKLGDRVRVKLTGECQVKMWEGKHPPDQTAFLSWYRKALQEINHPASGHVAAIDGATGTIDIIDHQMEELDPDWWHGHWYGVWFDHPIRMTEEQDNYIRVNGDHLAAIELEPLGTTGPYGRGFWPQLQYTVTPDDSAAEQTEVAVDRN